MVLSRVAVSFFVCLVSNKIDNLTILFQFNSSVIVVLIQIILPNYMYLSLVNEARMNSRSRIDLLKLCNPQNGDGSGHSYWNASGEILSAGMARQQSLRVNEATHKAAFSFNRDIEDML